MTDDVHHTGTGAPASKGVGADFRRFALLRLMRNMTIGSLTIVAPDGGLIRHEGAEPGPAAEIHVRRWRMLRRLLLEGNTGFGAAYLQGDWTTPDLAAVIEFAARNDSAVKGASDGLLPVRLFNRWRHALRANTLRGSKRNIMDHYDLGNSFFELWLDRDMNYSSALFHEQGLTLEQAQEAKQNFILDQLALSGSEHVLEIGCGWGSLAQKMIARGCRVTALTLSPAQRDYTVERLARAGLSDRADVRLQDYRDVQGKFDRVVSIEMLEAVGKRYWPAYFDVVRERLEDGGIAAIQVITIEDARFNSYESASDFIQRYIFPGGMLPSPSLLRKQIASSGFDLVAIRAFGESYAATLAEWAIRFQKNWTAIETLGFDQRFRRLWEYYLGYCEGGFRSGATDVGLYVLSRSKGAIALPADRA